MSASELQKAIDRLLKKEPRWREATQPPAKGAKPGQVATGRPATGAAGGQVAFEESDYALREYWSPVIIASADGLFTVEVEPIKSISLTGGGKAIFDEPPTAP